MKSAIMSVIYIFSKRSMLLKKSPKQSRPANPKMIIITVSMLFKIFML